MEYFFKRREEGESLGIFIGKIIVGTIIVIGLAILFGYVIMWLWNQLMPELFGLKSISYWQAVGLFILAKIFFGSGDCGGKKKNDCCQNSEVKNKFKTRLEKHCKENNTDWKYYDKFWEEEGKKAYKEFVERLDKNEEVSNS